MSDQTANSDLARKYDAVAYAAQSNALSHPRHLATVATLFGLAPRAGRDGPRARGRLQQRRQPAADGGGVAGRALRRLRPVAPRHRRSAARRGGTRARQRDAARSATSPRSPGIPTSTTTSSRTACTRGCRPACATRCSRWRRAGSSRNGVLFVSYNVYPGCHVRQAAWEMLHYHVDAHRRTRAPSSTPPARSRRCWRSPASRRPRPTRCCARSCGALSTQTDSALFHDDLAVPNDPVYFHAFAAHLARHGLAFVAEAKLSMMTAAGLAPARAGNSSSGTRPHRARAVPRLRADAPLPPVAREPRRRARRRRRPCGARRGHARRRVDVARARARRRQGDRGRGRAGPRRARRAQAAAVARRARRRASCRSPRSPHGSATHARDDVGAARPVAELLVDACFAGSVDLYVHPPRARRRRLRRSRAPARSSAGRRARQPAVTNLRHETLRIDDPFALRLLVLLDGTRTQAALAAAMAPGLPDAERAGADARVATCLAQFALHGLLVA